MARIPAWRMANMTPGYVMREVPEYGVGLFPVNEETGEVCECKMKWNAEGTVLSCPVCGLDGT